MRRIVKLLVVNHRVIARGKMTGYMELSGQRGDSYWF